MLGLGALEWLGVLLEDLGALLKSVSAIGHLSYEG